ncbi:hypothetical protein GA0115240_167016 [Streptomyces sp. DvalAA-14]|uniref:hypothetical protein n=1 Tax=unclassified Streptomyces TaxID=2593676 RepID=UPI00081B8B6D|nr:MULTISPECIES: hypothetical protein [unclassified Streptomyces]MYS24674.1 hypothetical protein [Streptomyces sp. SID4948]SCE48305.1 hypothetical protein GA0115240_167016 [Streptomyces sp. DvalAA-14]
MNSVTAPAPLPLHALSIPLTVLRRLAEDFPHLPAPTVDVTTIYPDRLTLTFFDNLPAFEAWRAALRISCEQVTCNIQSSGRQWRLNAQTAFEGATVCLVGYADVPQAGGESS